MGIQVYRSTGLQGYNPTLWLQSSTQCNMVHSMQYTPFCTSSLILCEIMQSMRYWSYCSMYNTMAEFGHDGWPCTPPPSPVFGGASALCRGVGSHSEPLFQIPWDCPKPCIGFRYGSIIMGYARECQELCWNGPKTASWSKSEQLPASSANSPNLLGYPPESMPLHALSRTAKIYSAPVSFY